jgi:uncharacterized protein (TIGR02271 family)
MEKAVVAVFDRQDEAQRASDALLEAGFSRDNVRLASAESVGMTSTSGEGQEQDSSITSKIASFLGFGKGRETDTYSEAVRRGSRVVSVEVANDTEAEKAQSIIAKYNPVDMDEREAQWRESDRSGAEAGAQTTGGEAIPIVEEQLRVGKRETQRGGARVVSRIQETPVEENVQLHEEHATVERRPADRPATEADVAAGEASLEARTTAEEAVVDKEARVVEEVVVGKEASHRTETISDSVRRTDVDVEESTNDTPASRKSDDKREPR